MLGLKVHDAFVACRFDFQNFSRVTFLLAWCGCRAMAAPDLLSTASNATIAGLHVMFVMIRLMRKECECHTSTCRLGGCAIWGCHAQPADETDEQEGRLATRLAEIRVQFCLALVPVWMTVCAFIAAAVLILRFAFGASPLSDDVMNASLFGSYITALLLRLRPSLVSKNSLLLLHTWFTGLLFLWAAYAAWYFPRVFLHNETSVILIRVALSFCYPMSGINFCWSAAWGVAAAIAKSSPDVTCLGMPLSQIVVKEIWTAIFFSYVLWKSESLQISQVRSDLQANGYLRAKKTMERLLADMCDAVVELDTNLCIRQPCPKLASLLLKHEGTTSLKDEPFASLVSTDEERIRFHDFVMQRAVPMEHEQNFSGDNRSSSMYLNLSDAYGTPVSVQLFHSCHHDPPDEVCHIVGVHEEQNMNGVGGERDTVGEVGGLEGHGTAHHVVSVDRDDTQSVASVASATSRASQFSIRVVPLVSEDRLQGPFSVIFDGLTYEVIGCTLGFQSLTGPLLFKASLEDSIVNFNEFRLWVVEEVIRATRDEPPSRIKLKFAHSIGKKRGQVEFHADASIVDVRARVQASELGVELSEDVDEEEFTALAVMTLSKPQPHYRDAPTGRRHRRASVVVHGPRLYTM